MAHVPVGASAEQTSVVTEADTAIALGSGDVPVLGTPRLIAWMEAAAVAALAPHLTPTETSVGTQIDVRHLAPTAVEGRVVVRAEVAAVDRRRISLTVEARHDAEQVGSGSHVRFVVDRDRFISSVTA